MKSYTNRHGRTVHYDDNGNKLGESYQSRSGRQVTHYDAEGRRIGRSYGDPDRRMAHYDNDGNRTGSSYTAYPGRMRHYDAAGSHTADTWNSCLGTTTRPAAGSCGSLCGMLAYMYSQRGNISGKISTGKLCSICTPGTLRLAVCKFVKCGALHPG